jgi:hypothetical protein
MDEVLDSAVAEVATHETSNQSIPNQEVQPEPAKVAEERRESPSREHFKRLENSKRELENELRITREINERLLQMTQVPSQPQQPDELDQISDGEYLAKGQVERLVSKKAEKIAQEQVERILRERDKSQFMEKLRGKYSDFDQVVNPETMSLLEEKDPELAQTIASSKDQYLIGLQCYKYIKAMNLAEKVPDARHVKEVEKKLVENSKTIQSPQAYDKRPMAQAFTMTDTEKKKLYAEMMGYASQAGFSY